MFFCVCLSGHRHKWQRSCGEFQEFLHRGNVSRISLFTKFQKSQTTINFYVCYKQQNKLFVNIFLQILFFRIRFLCFLNFPKNWNRRWDACRSGCPCYMERSIQTILFCIFRTFVSTNYLVNVVVIRKWRFLW